MLYSQSEDMLGSLVSKPLLGSSLCLEYHFTFLFIWLHPPHYSDLDQNVTGSGKLSLTLQTFRSPYVMFSYLPGHLCSTLQAMSAQGDRMCVLFFFLFFLNVEHYAFECHPCTGAMPIFPVSFHFSICAAEVRTCVFVP